MAGNITPAWQVIGGYTQATIKNGKDVAQDGSSSLPYTPEHAFTLWSQYQATDDICLARAHAISAVCIKVQTARWERQRLPKVTRLPILPNWGIELIAISTSS
ncbi:hypothetical protein ACLB1N_04325 [Escherichia coli]